MRRRSRWRSTRLPPRRPPQRQSAAYGERAYHSTRGHQMFLGHFGLAFGAKRAAPAVSLGSLFAACQFADLLWPTLLLLGYERVEVQAGATAITPLHFVSYPYSHSLVALCVWGLLFGAIHF